MRKSSMIISSGDVRFIGRRNSLETFAKRSKTLEAIVAATCKVLTGAQVRELEAKA
jgi:hypothetical protein